MTCCIPTADCEAFQIARCCEWHGLAAAKQAGAGPQGDVAGAQWPRTIHKVSANELPISFMIQFADQGWYALSGCEFALPAFELPQREQMQQR